VNRAIFLPYAHHHLLLFHPFNIALNVLLIIPIDLVAVVLLTQYTLISALATHLIKPHISLKNPKLKIQNMQPHIGISEKNLKGVSSLLSVALADAAVLYTKTRKFRINGS